ncbi:hypothetical protein RF55_13477 [Lasius niger]|uniref:Uncharacterized protein n=1 Tax=Lasius niger TaxID=67767 RepID=A0A0J7KA16_LASNI|nr:hypothetical protein RF55_13477 [Lasius niger]
MKAFTLRAVAAKKASARMVQLPKSVFLGKISFTEVLPFFKKKGISKRPNKPPEHATSEAGKTPFSIFENASLMEKAPHPPNASKIPIIGDAFIFLALHICPAKRPINRQKFLLV